MLYFLIKIIDIKQGGREMEIVNGENSIVKNILKGSIISIVITLVFFLIFALILTYTNISETTIFPVIVVITGISILIGSFLGSVKIRKNGLLNGGLIGLFYILALYLISSSLIGDFSLNFNSFILIIAAILAGMIGGIIGVNINK